MAILIENDNVNPTHYKNKPIETILKMEKIWGPALTAVHCELTAFKYRERIGDKPGQAIEDELGKIKWYESKAAELRNKCSEQELQALDDLVSFKSISIYNAMKVRLRNLEQTL